jgi:phosphate uptake regulator
MYAMLQKIMKVYESRKLITRGLYSLDVVLPAWWIRGHNLGAGSVVYMVATADKIVITPKPEGD